MRELALLALLGMGCATEVGAQSECRDPNEVVLLVADRSSNCSPDIDTASIKCTRQHANYDRGTCIFEGSYFCSGGVTSTTRLEFTEPAWGMQSFLGPDGCRVELVLVEGGEYD